MNLLLLDAHEIGPDGTAVLRGRRADHLRLVLQVTVGQEVRAGIIDGASGVALVLAVDQETVTVRLACTAPAPVAPRDTLVLAVPRPKVLACILEHATALGFRQILLTRTWRVDKSHLAASVLRPADIRAHLVAGLEQARRTLLPEVRLFHLFRPFVEDELPRLLPAGPRIVAHPVAAATLLQVPVSRSDAFTVAIGPEGGFIPFEIELLGGAGFVPVSCGPHPLRTETAVAVFKGQLNLLRDLARPS